MISSHWKIEFIPDGGTALLLLDYGGMLATPIPMPVEQTAEIYSSLGADWAGGLGLGNAKRTVDFTVRDEHASHAAAASFGIIRPATVLRGRSGTLRMSISGGAVWEFPDAVPISVAPIPVTGGIFATDTVYRFSCGIGVPTSGLAWYAGIPLSWTLDTHSSISRTHAAS